MMLNINTLNLISLCVSMKTKASERETGRKEEKKFIFEKIEMKIYLNKLKMKKKNIKDNKLFNTIHSKCRNLFHENFVPFRRFALFFALPSTKKFRATEL